MLDLSLSLELNVSIKVRPNVSNVSDETSTSLAPNTAQPDNCMDLRGTPCPLNFVRAKLRLQQMLPGELLELWIDAGEPVEQVPDSLTMAGYTIETLFEQADYFVLRVRCPVSAA